MIKRREVDSEDKKLMIKKKRNLLILCKRHQKNGNGNDHSNECCRNDGM